MKNKIAMKVFIFMIFSVFIFSSCSSKPVQSNQKTVQSDTGSSLEVPEEEVLKGYIINQWTKEYVVKSFMVNKEQILEDYKTAYLVCTIEATAANGEFGKKEEWEMNLTYYDIGGWECTSINKLNVGYSLFNDISEQECRSLISLDIPSDAKNIKVESLSTDKSKATARMTISYEYISDYFRDNDNVFGDVVHGYIYSEGEVFGSVTAKVQAVASFQYTDWEQNSGWKKTNYQLTDNTEYIYNLKAHATYESDTLITGQGGGIDFDIIVENNSIQISDGIWRSEGVNKASAPIKIRNAAIQWNSNEYGRFSDESHLCIRFSYDRSASESSRFPSVSDIGYLSFFGGNLGSESNRVSLYLEKSEYNTLWETWSYDEYAPTVEPLSADNQGKNSAESGSDAEVSFSQYMKNATFESASKYLAERENYNDFWSLINESWIKEDSVTIVKDEGIAVFARKDAVDLNGKGPQGIRNYYIFDANGNFKMEISIDYADHATAVRLANSLNNEIKNSSERKDSWGYYGNVIHFACGECLVHLLGTPSSAQEDWPIFSEYPEWVPYWLTGENSKNSHVADSDPYYVEPGKYAPPDWYQYDRVVVKDNILVTARKDFEWYEDGLKTDSLYVYYFDKDGNLVEGRNYELVNSKSDAKRVCYEKIEYGWESDNYHLYYSDNWRVGIMSRDYFLNNENYKDQLTLQDMIHTYTTPNKYSGYVWTVVYLN